MEEEIKIPEEMNVEVVDGLVTISNDGKDSELKLDHPSIEISSGNGKLMMESQKDNKKIKAVMGTFRSKINNAIEGLEDGFEYQMKIIYQHFPMDVAVKGDELEVKNFIGERKPRTITIPEGVDVEVDDEDIYVRGHDKERVGQTAADIEQKVRVTGKKDKRTFQDGIYITEKPR